VLASSKSRDMALNARGSSAGFGALGSSSIKGELQDAQRGSGDFGQD
jgi:hypothetical protein